VTVLGEAAFEDSAVARIIVDDEQTAHGTPPGFLDCLASWTRRMAVRADA